MIEHVWLDEVFYGESGFFDHFIPRLEAKPLVMALSVAVWPYIQFIMLQILRNYILQICVLIVRLEDYSKIGSANGFSNFVHQAAAVFLPETRLMRIRQHFIDENSFVVGRYVLQLQIICVLFRFVLPDGCGGGILNFDQF